MAEEEEIENFEIGTGGNSGDRGKVLKNFANSRNGGNGAGGYKIGQEHLFEILTSNDFSWQAIIYDLINTEQLDPWDINLALLSQKYLEKIREIEEANFFISSKVLLAASLLLRIKSEILLNHYIKSLDEILFGKEEEKQYVRERIEIDESELPQLYPKTPLPRLKRVTLQELMTALDKAISTETRRIKREISGKLAFRETAIVLPRKRINIKDKIREVYGKIKTLFGKKEMQRLSFSELAGKEKEERIMTFIPLLHLDHQRRIWLEQEKHFDEIWIWLRKMFEKQREGQIEELKEEVAETKEELDNEQLRRQKKLEREFENPLANFFDRASEIMKGNF